MEISNTVQIDASDPEKYTWSRSTKRRNGEARNPRSLDGAGYGYYRDRLYLGPHGSSWLLGTGFSELVPSTKPFKHQSFYRSFFHCRDWNANDCCRCHTSSSTIGNLLNNTALSQYFYLTFKEKMLISPQQD